MREFADFVNGIEAWHWWTLGAILIAIEIASTTFYLLWPGIAAIVVGLIKFFVPGLDGRVEIFLFAILAIVATIAWKRSPWGRVMHRPGSKEVNASRGLSYRGRMVTACEDFSGGRGAVLVDDTRWSAVTTDGSAPSAGSALEVVDADGTTLKVRIAI
ncbi:MAG TPA: NfeD family protein [Rhizomicrobium sp.]|nr:NfeD family protein [Rhizomicrobium sp.]